MKYVVVVLLVMHGLIHLLGFVKAFDLVQPPQMQATISRPVGLIWLIAALLLMTSAGVLALRAPWWWLLAASGVVLSQILIVGAWSDAKAGSIANVVLLLPMLVAALDVAPWGFRAQYDREVADRLRHPPQQVQLLTEADMTHLPFVVQRYLAFTGAVGRPQVWNYRLRFRGALRNGPNDRWMTMTAHQQSFVNPPARFFYIESSLFGIPFNAFHRYVGPTATFRVRLASLLTMVDARSAEMNQSETVTLFNDMCLLAPATLIDRNIVWEEVDPLTVRATWSNAGNTISAVLSFDSSGALVNFVSDDRYRTIDGKTYQRLRWSTPVMEWREFDGRKLPAVAEATWQLPEGEFAYARSEILEVAYNVADY